MNNYRVFSVLLALTLLLAAALPVAAAPESDLTQSPTRVSMRVGETRDLSGAFLRQGGAGEDELEWTLTGSVQWQSASPDIVSVDSAGTATALRVGTARLTASAYDNRGQQRSYAFVVGVSAAGSGQAANSFSVGEGKQLDLGALLFPGGQEQVAWSSTNEAVAITDAAGLVTATGIGSCTIKAEATGADGAVTTRRVKLQVASMYLTDYPKSATISLKAGETVDLVQVFYPQYVGTATAGSLVVTTADKEIVSVSGDRITGGTPGSCTVTLRLEKPAHEDDIIQQFTVQVR